MEQPRPLSFFLCLRRKTRSARRKETRRFSREELRTSKNVPPTRLAGVFRERSLLQQTLHPKTLRVSVPPSPPCLAPQAPPSREKPYLISIRDGPRGSRGFFHGGERVGMPLENIDFSVISWHGLMGGGRGFPMIGKKVSNGWKNCGDFSNGWKTFFQWLEKTGKFSNDWKKFSGVFQ